MIAHQLARARALSALIDFHAARYLECPRSEEAETVLGLVEPQLKRMARKFPRREANDLLQEARIGILKALASYRGGPFWPYAKRFAGGAMLRHMRDKFAEIRIPSYQQEQGMKQERLGTLTDQTYAPADIFGGPLAGEVASGVDAVLDALAMSPWQVARVAGCEHKTAKARLVVLRRDWAERKTQ